MNINELRQNQSPEKKLLTFALILARFVAFLPLELIPPSSSVVANSIFEVHQQLDLNIVAVYIIATQQKVSNIYELQATTVNKGGNEKPYE